jgi:hypothetical protein
VNPDTIRAHCDGIDALTQQIRDELLVPGGPEPPEPIEEFVVTDASDLQAALTAGGPVALAAGLTAHTGSGYQFDTSTTDLRGQGENCVGGDTNPALRVACGVSDITVQTLAVLATAYDSVVRIGKNDTSQVTIEAAPRSVTLCGVISHGHRGKRAFEINGADVTLVDCHVLDCYAPNNQDSQAIWIGNAPGPVLVDGGYFEAASECLMVGGDAMKIPDCRPTGLTIRNATFTKPRAWQDADIPVKNIFELKDGHDVLIENCDLSSCWKSAQDGYAFMFTPTRGGSLRNVVVKNCRVSDVGGIVNITGYDDDADTPPPRTQVAIYGGDYRTNLAGGFEGPGRFMLVGRGPESVIVEDAFIRHEGNALIDVCDDKPVDVLRVVGCDWNYGSYGIRIGGANHGDNAAGQIRELVITGNTISGAHSTFRDRYPDNTYTD